LEAQIDKHGDEFDEFTFLPLLAKRCLAGIISSTYIERTFSIATKYYTFRRNSLTAEYMESVIPLKVNINNSENNNAINDNKLEIKLEEFKKKFCINHELADTEKLQNSFRLS
ncbi:hypothetical protein C6P42_004141, partial [Pichia californica]